MKVLQRGKGAKQVVLSSLGPGEFPKRSSSSQRKAVDVIVLLQFICHGFQHNC